MLHYSRCVMVPTASSLAFRLGLLDDVDATLELGDYEHDHDPAWLRHAGVVKALWRRSRGADTRLIGLSWHRGTQRVYTLPDSNVVAAADLAGKRIALIQDPGLPFDIDRAVFLKAYNSALHGAGLSLDDVIVIDTPMTRELAFGAPLRSENFFQQVGRHFLVQLLRGEVDAIACPLPPEMVRFFRLHVVYDAASDPDPEARRELRALTVSGAALREHRDTVVRIVAALLEAGRRAAADPDGALALMAEDLGVAPDVLRVRGIDSVELAAIDLLSEQLVSIDAKAAMLRRAGMLDADVDVAGWVDRSVLAEARLLV